MYLSFLCNGHVRQPDIDAMLKLTRPNSLVESVVSSIRSEISSGRLPAESRLPTEHQLAEQLSVSRSVIREAISQLKADGVLVIRRGSGSFVSPIPGGTVFRLPNKNGSLPDLTQLFEMRLWIEIQAASIAAQRCTGADLARMENAMELMAGNAKDFWTSSAADVEFHRAIVAACKNDYFIAFHDFLGGQLAQARFFAWENSSKLAIGASGAHHEHQEMFQAISKHDSDAAGRCAREHLEAAAQRLNIHL